MRVERGSLGVGAVQISVRIGNQAIGNRAIAAAGEGSQHSFALGCGGCSERNEERDHREGNDT